MLGVGNRTPGLAVDKDRIGHFPGQTIDDPNAFTFRREVFVAPGQQCNQHRAKIASASGRQILVARRMFLIEPRLDDAVCFEFLQSLGEDGGREGAADGSAHAGNADH